MQRLVVLSSVGLDNRTVACTLVFLFILIAPAAWARLADDAMDDELEPDAEVPDEANDGCLDCTVYTACTVPAVTAGCTIFTSCTAVAVSGVGTGCLVGEGTISTGAAVVDAGA